LHRSFATSGLNSFLFCAFLFVTFFLKKDLAHSSASSRKSNSGTLLNTNTTSVRPWAFRVPWMSSVENSRVSDRLAIVNFFTLYAKAVDRKDWVLFNDLFTDDAFLDYKTGMKFLGMDLMPAEAGKKDEVCRWLTRALAMFRSQHLISNVEIDWYDERAARVRAMYFNPMTLIFIPKITVFTCGGFYNHEMVKCDDGKWRSKRLLNEEVYQDIYYTVAKVLLVLISVFMF